MERRRGDRQREKKVERRWSRSADTMGAEDKENERDRISTIRIDRWFTGLSLQAQADQQLEGQISTRRSTWGQSNARRRHRPEKLAIPGSSLASQPQRKPQAITLLIVLRNTHFLRPSVRSISQSSKLLNSLKASSLLIVIHFLSTSIY